MPEKLQQLNENFLDAEKFPYDFVCIQRKIHDARKKRIVHEQQESKQLKLKT